MIDKQLLTESIERAIAGTDIFIVDIKVSPDNSIVVELDSPQALDIDTCAKVTRAIEADFDREVEDYELEIGSAGLTAPFKVRGQYVKNIGNKVEVLTRDGRKYSGTLTEVGDDTFTVEVSRKVKPEGKKRPEIIAEPIVTSFDNAKRVNYLIEF